MEDLDVDVLVTALWVNGSRSQMSSD